MKVDKSTWYYRPFTQCVRTIKVKEAIQKKAYNTQGKFPIVSQEKEFISGYCDSIENLNSDLGKLIIFGDHTRVLKFVDFDFCVGADGVKVLRPFGNLDTKILYYFLLWADIPSNGYSRHFKFLKELNVPHPPIDEQHNIAAELDALQEVIDGYREQIADLDSLAQSIFLDTFGDPITNPKRYQTSTIGEVCTLKSGDSSANNFPSGNTPYLKVADMNLTENQFKVTTSSRYVDENTKPRSIFPTGTVIFPKRGGAITTGKLAIASKPIICDLNIMGIIPSSNLNSIFLYYYFKQVDFSKLFDGTSVPQINNSDIAPLKIILPPIEMQQQFAAQVEAIEGQKALLLQQMADAEMLMAERMQYYFS